jgi:hypothetical protein
MHPQKPPRQTTLQHVGLAFPTPRKSFNISVIDRTLQIRKLPLSPMLLALNSIEEYSPPWLSLEVPQNLKDNFRVREKMLAYTWFWAKI